MTEEEWLACADPQAMLALVYAQCGRRRGRTPTRSRRANRRSLRLFACAVCRTMWDELAGNARDAILASEAFADDPARIHDLNAARAASHQALATNRHWHQVLGWLAASSQEMVRDNAAAIIASVSTQLTKRRLGWELWDRPYQTDEQRIAWRAAQNEAFRPFCALLRDLFLLPSRDPAFVSAWRTPTALLLARAAYHERMADSGLLDPARLGVLSDALEEAGAEGEILAHLRSPGPHARGCWALDLILGYG